MKINWNKISWWLMCFITIVSISLAIIASQKRNYWKNQAGIYKYDSWYYESKMEYKQKRIDSLTNFIINYEKQDFHLHQKSR